MSHEGLTMSPMMRRGIFSDTPGKSRVEKRIWANSIADIAGTDRR